MNGYPKLECAFQFGIAIELLTEPGVRFAHLQDGFSALHLSLRRIIELAGKTDDLMTGIDEFADDGGTDVGLKLRHSE
ncbi:hypothetical protein [Desulfosporosinus sp. BG]|uniref:hypothetical protein n=1 Tax=Desulfosporosinus sp. BG TaxID=1633135 RepID=UPI00083A125C|nr:hypothetical protein [Desulfosporosinus sp. BG]ODA42902.1 hypothetical protein DSBG_0252 [Desulfosporosinus sp. BG]